LTVGLEGSGLPLTVGVATRGGGGGVENGVDRDRGGLVNVKGWKGGGTRKLKA